MGRSSISRGGPEGADGPKPSGGATRVHSVDRAARLLHLIASTPEHERTVKELAAKMGTSLPSMYHLVNTLVDARLLTRDRRRLYHLGLGIGTLANAYYQQSQPPIELLDPLQAIIQATGETAYLGGLVRGELEVLAEMAGTRAVRVTDLKPGYRGAAHARASGKVLLAFSDPRERNRYLGAHPLQPLTAKTITDSAQLLAELDQVRRQGYATEVEEFTEGVACCAVPILDDGILLAAYTLAAPVERYRTSKDEYIAVLKAAAESVILPQSETGGEA
jgi:IclR family acetate operon transcriptional repressor